MRNSRPSKQVVVQRLLPLQPGVSNSYGLVTTQEEYVKSMLRPNGAGGTGGAAPSQPPITELLDAAVTPAGVTSLSNNKIKLITNNNDDGRKSSNSKASATVAKHTNISGNSPANQEQVGITSSVDDDSDDDSLSDDPGIKSLLEISLPSPVMTNHEGWFFFL